MQDRDLDTGPLHNKKLLREQSSPGLGSIIASSRVVAGLSVWSRAAVKEAIIYRRRAGLAAQWSSKPKARVSAWPVSVAHDMLEEHLMLVAG
jgi:hypothetical protein